jgi:hypothetical protein
MCRAAGHAPGGGGVGADHHCVDVEAIGELALPLLAQVRRAQHGHALDFAAVEHFARNQRAFDGLADADVVGNQQADRGLLQGHQQRHQLVGARLDCDVAEAAKGSGSAAQLELQRIQQQLAGRMVARLVDTRPGESGWLNRLRSSGR